MGDTIYYPWGVLSKGYIIPDKKLEDRIRTFLRRYYQISFVTIIVIGILQGWIVYFLVVPLCWLWFHIGMKFLLTGLPTSDVRLKLSESYKNASQSHNAITLWLLLICGLLFVAVGTLVLSYGELILGLIVILFFGLATVAIGYMIYTRSQK